MFRPQQAESAAIIFPFRERQVKEHHQPMGLESSSEPTLNGSSGHCFAHQVNCLYTQPFSVFPKLPWQIYGYIIRVDPL